jgi:uncharacterized phage protein gp47/JayE
MALATPTTAELADNITAQIELAIGQTIPLLPKAFTRVLAKALAGVIVLLYKYAGFIFLQMFVAYATNEETLINGRVIRPLTEWGRLIGVGDPEAATRAELTITVSVTNQTGTLPAGSQLLYAPSGVVYLTTAAVALNAATVTVTIRAASDQTGGTGEGAIGNLEVADVVSFANPLPNVATNAVVASVVVTGADGETVEAYRARIVRRFQRKPQGGAYADYQIWGESVAGIAHVYPYTGNTPGEVDIYVEATEASSGSADGIPTGAQLDAVFDAIELDENGLASNRPAGAAVNVYAITRTGFEVEVTGLDADDMTAAEDTIEQAVDEYLRAREPFIVGLSALPRLDRVTRAAISGVVDDAVSAVGGTITTVVLKLGGIPTEAHTLGQGEKAKLDSVSFL